MILYYFIIAKLATEYAKRTNRFMDVVYIDKNKYIL